MRIAGGLSVGWGLGLEAKRKWGTAEAIPQV